MNDRSRALEILKRARDILAEQLTDRVLQASDGILEDALGMSYVGEIDALFEQLGTRLAHLNALIANLPPVQEMKGETSPTDEAAPAPAAATPEPPSNGPLALPAPRSAVALPVP